MSQEDAVSFDLEEVRELYCRAASFVKEITERLNTGR